MIRPRQMLHLIRINLVLIRHGLDEVVLATRLFRPVRWLSWLLPWTWFRRNPDSRGERIRRALEDLGPIFVKFGQILSTRRDLLPPDIADQLSYLQDRVPPFPAADARDIITRAYGCPPDAVFARFDDVPLASASIAQVHSARLLDGREVVVKVVRPGIFRVIRRDLELMHSFADVLQRYSDLGRRLRPREVVEEFERNLIDELDLLREAANASQLRRNFLDSDKLYVPDVMFEHSRRTVMVMERVSGTPIGHIEALRARGVDLKVLAEKGVEIFFTQVFRDSFFHADMHPGNIFVDTTDPADPRYIAVDFGIVGTLNPTDHRYLAENFLAFFDRDYRRVAELHVESGWVPPDTRVDEFEGAIRTVCEPIFERPLRDISFGAVLLRLFETGRRFDMVVQPQLVLLQKTLLNIEGLGRDLYPDLDLWQTAKPYMQRWMREQLGGRALLRRIRQQLPAWGEQLPDLPGKLMQAVDDLDRLRDDVRRQATAVQELRDAQQRGNRLRLGLYTTGVLALAALVVSLLDQRASALLPGDAAGWSLSLLGLAGIGLVVSLVRR
ncbi:ubiquinone biosynthesis regulatory protein kinase UbiB [Methylonatrum kenyense]|uniref:ubiquinone biosynthesis regulatory protein kinase UbiB n=1 Tax=Methylonatrum kenyense TaxID=455253 RepID=UPI0020BDAFEA|nr:ubiquinone biosynthesis regulatory protein kinase UbiB [Methylonatrum kenyense]MCK8515282.1 ubiquinone biosynthesis regulatory protein kinase UbiB [Methylonatrum kenyense]